MEHALYVFSPSTQALSLHWRRGGRPYGTLDALRADLLRQGRCPLFLSNAGIYGTNGAPLGLHVEAGKVLKGLNRSKGTGNFFWQSGVFAIRRGKPEIVPRSTWRGAAGVSLATQSGPLLVLNGKRTSAGRASANGYSRSAVVIYRDGRLGFVHSRWASSFAALVDRAARPGPIRHMLYLDGSINDWWQPGQTQSARHTPRLAAMFAVTSPGATCSPD